MKKIREALEDNIIIDEGNLLITENKIARFNIENRIKKNKEALKSLDQIQERLERLESEDKGEVSDGYHTFNELYEHRHALFANVVNQSQESWKSKLHDDGTMFDGWFIAGISTKDGDVTYHLPLKHWELFQCKELEKAPKWDGHTSDVVVSRLKAQAAISTISKQLKGE